MHSLTDDTFTPLPIERREQVAGWARVQHATSYVWRPTTVDEIRAVLALAQSHGRTVALCGGGHSYTDATLNAEGITINLSQMQRILAWNAQQGIITVEPGVTISTLVATTMADGWWPAVVPSTLTATVGGCLAMNVHGKNAWKHGSLGEQVLAIELLSAAGDLITVTPSNDPELFHAVIGGLGMIGVITSITLQLQPIQSSRLLMYEHFGRSLSEMLAIFAEEEAIVDHLEGWCDGYADNYSLGRGFVICARSSDKPEPRSLQLHTHSPTGISRIVPYEFLGRALRPALAIGSSIGNTLYYRRGVLPGSGQIRDVSLEEFHFRPEAVFRFLRGLIPTTRTMQPFVPAQHAHTVFTELLKRSQRAGLVSFWCCLKQHRADPFLLSCQVDGFSLELNYPVTPQNAQKLELLFTEMREIVIAAGGRFYLAKDDVFNAESYTRSMGTERVERFLAVKDAYDPQALFQSALFRRVFA